MVFISGEHIVRSASLFLSLFDSNLFKPPTQQPVLRRHSQKKLQNYVLADVFQNPIINENLPDPSVTKLPDDSGYVLVATSDFTLRDNNTRAFPIYFSKDLIHWTLKTHVFSGDNFPAWSNNQFYAPELHHVNGHYLLYFAAAKADKKHAVGVAIANSPFGRYKDLGQMLVDNPKSVAGVIDPHLFRDPVSHKLYLLWKQDDPFSFQTSAIYIRELDKTGTSFKGVPARILVNNLAEERFIAEAPWLMYKKGYYYLFYSSGWYSDPHYNVRVAKSKSPTGPFIKKKFPVLETNWIPYNQGVNTTFVGPGHCSVVSDGGDWWMIFHSWMFGAVNTESPGRVVCMDKIKWKNGWPTIGSPSTERIVGPRL